MKKHNQELAIVDFKDSMNTDNGVELARKIIRASGAIGGRRNTILVDHLSHLEMFGIQLMKIRRCKHLDLSDISKRTGIDIDTLGAIELGLLPFDEVVQLILAISEALEVDSQKLCSFLFKPLLEH